MSRTNDNWERLVRATLKRDQLWQIFHDHSRTPSSGSASSGANSDPVQLTPDRAPTPTNSSPTAPIPNPNQPNQMMRRAEYKNTKSLGQRKFSRMRMRLDRWIWSRWTLSK
ncbi:hypothetical protein ACJIZ3_011019 [Penstemon smallii]|uniref:Uncharacterized protein n=1 Tax=Penstemon smallii TaxID=265156 RepID=A0ABD3UI39_9LAMI